MQNSTSPNNIRVRVFRHSEDAHHVRRLYVSGVMHGSGAPYAEVAARVSSRLFTSSVTFAAGLVGIYTSSSLLAASARRLASSIGGHPSLLTWVSSALACLSGIACIRAWFQLRKIRGFIEFHTEQALSRDLSDIVGAFQLTPAVSSETSNTNELEANGPNGFWVAEDENSGEVVGCVGLDNTSRDDPTIGEVRRLTVTPSYRRKGIGETLMNIVVDHGRAKGLKSLWLSTSGFNVAAVEMYKRKGWRLDATRRENLAGIPVDVVSFRKELE